MPTKNNEKNGIYKYYYTNKTEVVSPEKYST